MRTRNSLLIIIAFSAVIAGACGGQPAANQPTPNVTNTNTSNPLEVKTPEPAQTTNNAPTLAPVFKAYCDAWVKKDEAALRKVYSSDTIKYFETQMKAEKSPTLMKYLEDDAVTGKLCEVRNEEINGDSAVAEIRADSYPNGVRVVFVKENGEWKLTNKSPAIDAVKNSGGDSTAGKSSSNSSSGK